MSENPFEASAAPKKKKIVWTKVGESGRNQTGLNIGVYGLPKSGKSTLGATAGFMNLKYADKLPPGIVKKLKNGSLPEIQRVRVIDTEPFTWDDRILRKFKGITYSILKPLIEEKVFVITPIGTTGKPKREDATEKMDMFEDALVECANDCDEGTLVIVDSMSDFYTNLNNDFKIKEGKEEYQKSMKPGEEAWKAINRAFWNTRNGRWDAAMRTIMRGKCWWHLTFKMVKTDQEYVDLGSPPFRILWVSKSEFLPQVMVKTNKTYKQVKETDANGVESKKTAEMFDLHVDWTAFPIGDENFDLPSGKHARLAYSRLVENLNLGDDETDVDWW